MGIKLFRKNSVFDLVLKQLFIYEIAGPMLQVPFF